MEGIPRRSPGVGVRQCVRVGSRSDPLPFIDATYFCNSLYFVTPQNRVTRNHDMGIVLFLVCGRGGMDEFAILNREFGLTLRSVWN